MNSMRSMWKLFAGVASVGLLVTNCTIKTDDDDGKAGAGNNANAGAGNNASAGAGNTSSGDCSPVGKRVNGCTCPGNLVSYQLCTTEGIYGACVCDSPSNGGASSYAGASNAAGEAGAPTNGGNAGAAAEGGAAGDTGLVIDPADCPTCLTTLCPDEWEACADDNETTTVDGAYCLSQGTNADPGQIELILDCINTERFNGLVKRDAVRACGSSIGQSADPSFFQWAPVGMTPATENLMNCMADAPDETMPGDWATDTTTNFPAAGPRPWDDMTCAKLACTSKLSP
jgi:hypothetical protein